MLKSKYVSPFTTKKVFFKNFFAFNIEPSVPDLFFSFIIFILLSLKYFNSFFLKSEFL